MAFIRSYSEQGDPFPMRATLRAGTLVARPWTAAGRLRPRKTNIHLADPRIRRMLLAEQAGDPFFKGLGKLISKGFKAVKKLQPGKLLAKAVTMVDPTGLSGMLFPQSAPPEAAPELTYAPAPTGTVSQAASGQSDFMQQILAMLQQQRQPAPRRARYVPEYYDEEEYYEPPPRRGRRALPEYDEGYESMIEEDY